MDLRGQQTATAGEAVSNRHVINVKDESGKKVRGFFSVKTSASIEQDFNARIKVNKWIVKYDKGIHQKMLSYDKKWDCQMDFLKTKNEFVNGLSHILEVSEKYHEAHDMQAACGAMLDHGLKKYMETYKSVMEARYPNKQHDLYKSLGLSPEFVKHLKQVSENGRKVMEKYETEKMRKNESLTNQPTERLIGGMEEVN